LDRQGKATQAQNRKFVQLLLILTRLPDFLKVICESIDKNKV